MKWLGYTQTVDYFLEGQIFPPWIPPASFSLSFYSAGWLMKNAAVWIWAVVTESRFYSYTSAGLYANRTFTISIQISSLTNRFCTLQLTWLLCFSRALRNIKCCKCKWKLLPISHPLQSTARPAVLKMMVHMLWLFEFSTACA